MAPRAPPPLWVAAALVLAVSLAATPAARTRHPSPLDRLMRARFPSTTEAPPQRDWASADYDAADDDADVDYQDATPPPGPPEQMSPLSQQKWALMGSRQAVDAFRQSRLRPSAATPRLSGDNEVQLAVENALRVNREHECRLPARRLVRVKDVFPHPNKRYIPHCASLHRCGDDAGCCHSDTLACVAAKTHPVSLYFYTTTAGSRAVVEKLTFENHTECRCEDRSEAAMPRDMPATPRPPRGSHHHHSSKVGGCRCPAPFSARRLHGGATCRCECFGHDPDCLRLRRGKAYFTSKDKFCIQSGDCSLPGCEYGQYIHKAGRCPRKRERISSWEKAGHHHTRP